MPLPEGGIELFDKGGLLGSDLDGLACQLLFQLQPAVVFGAETGLVQDLLDGDRRDAHALERQYRLQAVAAIGRMLQRQGVDAGHRLRRRGHGVRLVDRRQVLQAFEAVGLEAALPLVEAGAVHSPAAAGFRRIAELFGKLKNAQTLLGKLAGGIPPGRFRWLR